MTSRGERHPGEPPEAGTRALLDHFTEGDPNEIIQLDEVLADLKERGFAMLLFLSVPIALIPGVAGAISGPLVVLVGLQLLFGRSEPWLPAFIGRRGPHRRAMATFRDRLGPWLTRLERVVQPRAAALLNHRISTAFTGLNLTVLGVLLSLPIPFTNVLFALLILLFALALLERDGRLLAVAWLAGGITIATLGALSGSLAAVASQGIALLP